MNITVECIGLVKEFFLSFHDYDFLDTPAIVNIVLNAILSLTAIILNGTIIVTILSTRDLQTPSYLLLASMAAVDFLVGMLYHPFQIVLCVFYLQRYIQGICSIVLPFNFVITYLGALSFSMVASISVDRYLALSLGSNYRHCVTKRRIRRLIVTQWILVAFLAAFSTWANILPRNLVWGFWLFLAFFCFFMTSVFYIKSFKALVIQRSQVQNLPANIDIQRYDKVLTTMLTIFGFLLLCYLPVTFAVAANVMYLSHKVIMLLYMVALTILGLNSSMNPAICLARFPDIRRAILMG